MKRTLTVIPVFLLVAVAAAVAQEETLLTEDEFLSVLDEAHPASIALSGDMGAAEARRQQAALLEDPRLEFVREQLDDLPRETVWGVAWTPPIDGRRRWAVREAEAGVEAERSSYESELTKLRLEMRRVFADWAEGHTRVSIVIEHFGRLESLAQRMRHRAELGEESVLNARRLEIASRSSAAELSSARADTIAAQAEAEAWLVSSIGPPGGTAATGSDSSAIQPVLPELPEIPEGVDSSLRPDLMATRFRVEQAEAQNRLSHRVIAAPELLLGWQTIKTSAVEFDGPVFGLNWEIPIFDRRQADRSAARTAVASALARSEWLTRQAQGEYSAALGTYVELRDAAISAQETLADLGRVVEAATAAYEQGESSVTDLLDTLRAVLDARLSALDLYSAALEAHRNLELTTGRSLTSGGLS